MRVSSSLVVLLVAAALLLMILGQGCSKATTPSAPPVATTPTSPSAATTPPPTPASGGKEVTVLAAASMTEALTALKPPAEAKLGGKVTTSFGGSQELRTALENGSAADVFISANMDHIDALAKKGLLKDPFAFAHNKLALVVPKGNPAGIKSVADLGAKKLRLVIAVKDCPAGKYAHKLLDKCDKTKSYGAGFSQKVLKNVVSEETDVKGVLTKVRTGAADAGIVYVSDVTPEALKEVEEVKIPDDVQQVATYGVGIPTAAKNAEGGRAFVEYMLSPNGQQLITASCKLEFIASAKPPWKSS